MEMIEIRMNGEVIAHAMAPVVVDAASAKQAALAISDAAERALLQKTAMPARMAAAAGASAKSASSTASAQSAGTALDWVGEPRPDCRSPQPAGGSASTDRRSATSYDPLEDIDETRAALRRLDETQR